MFVEPKHQNRSNPLLTLGYKFLIIIIIIIFLFLGNQRCTQADVSQHSAKSAKRTIMFTGQGSQTVGMGKELAETFKEARDVFHQVDETLKLNLSTLMFSGEQV
jgi:hypothetical protein